MSALQGDCSAERQHLPWVSASPSIQCRQQRRAASRGTRGDAPRRDHCVIPSRRESEYCVVISITNEQGEKIARHVVGVGALAPGERHKFTFSVDVVPARGRRGKR